MVKRTFKQVFIQNSKLSEGEKDGKDDDEHLKQVEITSQNLEDNASII